MTTPSHPRSFASNNYPPASSSSDYSPTSTSTPFATPATRATSIAPSTFSRSGPGNRRAKFSMLTSNAADESPLQAIHASPTPTGSRSATPASMDDAANSNKEDVQPSSSLASSSATTTLNARQTARTGIRGRTAPSVGSTSAGSPLTSNAKSAAASASTTATKPGNATSSSTATASASTGSPAMTKDAEDFFARAQAMGLRLTREDYERTKAGVAAFLKAERKPFVPTATTSTATTSASTSKANDAKASSSSQSPAAGTKSTAAESLADASKTVDVKPGASQSRLTAPSPLTRPGGPTWSRNTSSPGLSFFTAVIEPQDSPGSPKIHPSLDQVGNAEERRRLKIKKQKLRQRRERERALAAAANAASTSSKASNDLLATPNSTVVQSSPEAGSSSAFRTPPARTHSKKGSCSSIKSASRVGLGLDLNGSDSTTSPDPSTPPEGLSGAFGDRRSRGRTVSFESSPVVRVSDEVRECSSLEELSRRAWVSPRGTLRLLKSPIEHDAVFCSPPMDVDDSGVCFHAIEPASSAVGGLAADGWGAVHRRTLSASSNGTSAPAQLDNLDTKMSGLSFLDRIMSKQTSPRRLYKAEKLRQKQAAQRKVIEEQVQAELAAQEMAEAAARAEYEQKEAVKAAAAADAIKAANPDYASLVLSTPNAGSKTRKSPDSVVRATPLESSSSRALRWTTIGASPSNMHMRMTTREHYDFTMHGISPSQPGYDSLDTLCNIHSTPGPITFSAWDAEPLTSLRKGTDANRSSLRGSSAITPAAHFLLSTEEHRPELIGVSPSVAGFFHARQASAQASVNSSLMRASSQDVAVMSPLSGRLVSGVASRMSDLDFDADDDIGVHHDDAAGLGKPAGFNAKRGLLFSVPGGTALDPPPASLGEAVQLDDGAGKAFVLPTSSPMRLGRSLRAGTAGDEMIGGKLPFASPRSALVRAQSGTAIDTRHNRQPSGNIRDFLGSGPSANRHKRGLSRKIDTISPADVFGSSLPRTVSAPNVETRQPLPEPSKGERDGVDGPVIVESQDDSSVPNRNKKGKKASEARRVQSDSPSSPSKQLMEDGKTSCVDSAVLMHPSADVPGVAVNRMTHAGPAEPVIALFAPMGSQPLAAGVGDVSQPPSTKKSKKAKAAASAGSDSSTFKVIELPCQDFERMARAAPSVQNGDEIGWDQPDGSRLVKLVSEELKAALDAGTLVEEPAARYYLLPPGFGQSKAKPSSVSYAGLIGQAIKSSSDMRLSLSEVYDWISSTYPFFEKGDRGWQNSIRHNLSLNKSFVKIEREANMPGKGGWWGIKPGHEDRFQNGLYNAVPQKFEAAKARQQQQQQNQANKVMDSPDAVERALAVSDGDAMMPSSQARESVDGSAKKRSKAKRKKAQAGDAADSGDESDKESSRLLSSKKAKVQAQPVMADRLPLLETQPQNGAPMGGAGMAINGLDSITPVRPHVGSSVYSSSNAGSTFSKTIPGLVDSASSPPSSPLTLMPPPSMQATANHSARKRKLAGQGNGQLGYGSGFSPSLYAMRGSALGGAFAFSNGMVSDTSRGSPLRRQTKGSNGDNGSKNSSVTSPKRLWSISSPMSSMRGQKDEGMRSPTSTARVAAALARSPIRSSPLRSGAAGMLSPNSSASLQMQLAMGGGAGQMGFNGAGFGAGLGMGSGLAPGVTPGSLRFASGLSPGRRSFQSHQMMGMSLAGAAPQTMQQQAWYLDDPFEMQANLQQQHQHQQMVQHHQIHAQPGHGGMDPPYSGFSTEGLPASPLRQAWNSIQAAGGIQAFTTGAHGFGQARQ